MPKFEAAANEMRTPTIDMSRKNMAMPRVPLNRCHSSDRRGMGRVDMGREGTTAKRIDPIAR
jgi:hypothetical protein